MDTPNGIKIRDIIGRNPGDWPTETEDNGNYRIECKCCGAVVSGPKHAIVCYPCHLKGKAEWDALTPEQQQERRIKLAKEIEEIFKQYKL